MLGVLIFRDVTERRAMLIGAVLAVGLIFTQSLTSHGAAVSDPPILPLAIDFIHLLATAIWVGGLFQLLVSARCFDTGALAKLIATFSLVAFSCVGVIIVTGTYSMVVQVGSLEAFFDTVYGAALFTKLILIIPLLALGALNLLVTRPALAETVAQRMRAVVADSIAVALEIALRLWLFAVGVLAASRQQGAYDPAQNADAGAPRRRSFGRLRAKQS
jgi:copper transport protein